MNVLRMLCTFIHATYVIRTSCVPKKFCEVFPVIFYGIVGATIINIAVVTIKNAVRMWNPEKAEKVKSPQIFCYCQFMILFKIFTNAKSIMGTEIPVNRYPNSILC